MKLAIRVFWTDFWEGKEGGYKPNMAAIALVGARISRQLSNAFYHGKRSPPRLRLQVQKLKFGGTEANV